MTREQLDAIRARMTFEYGPHTDVREILHATKDLHALLAEVERLTADPLPAAAWVREVERAAFKRGVAAMRDALLQRFDWHGDVADRIRAEPVPEDKP